MTITEATLKPLEQVNAVKSIDSLPIDLQQNLFAHYPAMKLGMNAEVTFYAKKLAEIAEGLIEAKPDESAWVITAPPYNIIPAAANLMASQVFELLKNKIGTQVSLSLVSLRFPKKSLAINNAQEFKTYYEYSNNSISERIKERAKLHQDSDDIVNHEKDFSGRNVIVINDIKVTGTQQKFMQQSFAQVEPAYLHWLYVFAVDQELGKADPQIEHRINHSQLQTLVEFSELIRAEPIVYTARCISRLFSYELDEFNTLVQQLSTKKRAHILAIASQEGRFDGDYFADKMSLLETLCAEKIKGGYRCPN